MIDGQPALLWEVGAGIREGCVGVWGTLRGEWTLDGCNFSRAQITPR